MKNKSLMVITPLFLILLLSGCGSRYGQAFKITKDVKVCTNHANKHMKDSSFCELTINNELINVYGRGDSSMFTITRYNLSTAAGLQVASQTTIQRDHKYFAIAYPPQVSNFHGSLLNTPEDFFKKCDIGASNVVGFNLDPCNIHYHPGGTNLVIVTYSERPENVLTYDAKEVLNYLMKKERFDKKSSVSLKK